MKIAAGIIGLLVGLFSLTYVGLFGGMLGGAAGWFASVAPAGNDMTQWADTVKTLSWLAPSLVLIGGGITFGSPLIGGSCMALGAFLLWYLMGFGSIGNDFIVPSAGAALLAFVASIIQHEKSENEAGPREASMLERPIVSSPAPTHCTSCSHENARNAKFCSACGSTLGAPADVPPVAAVLAVTIPASVSPDESPSVHAAAAPSSIAFGQEHVSVSSENRIARLSAYAGMSENALRYSAVGAGILLVLVFGLWWFLHDTPSAPAMGAPPAIAALPRPASPSFNCLYADSWALRSICADAYLAAQDRRMANLYGTRMRMSPSRESRLALRTAQRAWLRERDGCGGARLPHECLVTMYQARIAALAGTGLSALPSPVSASYENAAQYCAAVGTSDDPHADARYSGPAVTDAMVAAVNASSRGATRDIITWRCADGRILACAEFNTVACGKAPWLSLRDERIARPIRDICRQYPNDSCTPGTHCIYMCRDGNAFVNRNQYPLDPRGYNPQEWVTVSEP